MCAFLEIILFFAILYTLKVRRQRMSYLSKFNSKHGLINYFITLFPLLLFVSFLSYETDTDFVYSDFLGSFISTDILNSNFYIFLYLLFHLPPAIVCWLIFKFLDNMFNMDRRLERADSAYNKQKFKTAFRLYNSVATWGYVDQIDSAENNLGLMYHNGEGVQKNIKEAIKWYTLSADKENVDAQVNLAKLLYNGIEVDEDLEEAFRLFSLAAAQQDPYSQFWIGIHFQYNEDPDLGEAIQLYRLSAEQGYAPAQVQLGSFYYNGNIVKKDIEQAIKWTEFAWRAMCSWVIDS